MTGAYVESAEILVVEDNPIDETIVVAALRPYTVKVARNIQEARQAIVDRNIKLVILDVNLPDGDGFRFMREIQDLDSARRMTVVFLTAKNDVNERVFGLNMGAQDYICKPVEPMELKARVEARLRSLSQTVPVDTFQKGDLHFNLSLRQLNLVHPGQQPVPIDLTTLEFNVLYHFARHEQHVLTREQLLDAVWGRKAHEVTDRSVDSLVSGLRKKIASSQYQLRAVYGSGYSFSKKDSTQSSTL